MDAKRWLIGTLAIGLACTTAAAAQAGPVAAAQAGPPAAQKETSQQHDARMRWWREAHFGMFIHWGVYSELAGIYHGKKVRGLGEWIMHDARIPVAEYKKIARKFNPVKYDPNAWVSLAKRTGMKYIVITAKHHDGFALFDSKVTDFDVVNATAWGKDLLKPLAEACRKQGIRLGFYYSQAQDWTHPGGAALKGHWDPVQDGSMDEYLKTVAVPQVRELLTNYGPASVLWWDFPIGMTPERAALLRPLLKLQPGIITNNRLGGGYRGDTETPEQNIPSTGIPGRDWETCMTINGTWGYKSYEHNWKSTETLLRNLVDIVSKGGNYLLNVGPTGEGEIPAPCVERLEAIGKWMAGNGEAIYSTTASPCRRPFWGRITTKRGPNNTTFYLHVFDWPADGRLQVPLANEVQACYLLADSDRSFHITRGDDGMTVQLTGSAPDAICSVVVLKVAGAPKVLHLNVSQAPDGSVTLAAPDAAIHDAAGTQLRCEVPGSNIGYWFNPKGWVEWKFKLLRPGSFDATAMIASPADGVRLRVEAGGREVTVAVPQTGSYGKYRRVKIGHITLSKAGLVSLSLRPVVEGWHAINLRSITLKPSAGAAARPAGRAATAAPEAEKEDAGAKFETQVNTDAAIRRYRMGTLTVLTRPGATVKVTQLKHEFEFGTAVSWSMLSDKAPQSDRSRYAEVLKANFNAAVPENSLKWHNTEPDAQGVYNWGRADRVLDWCQKNALPMRGHCIFWASKNRVQEWVKTLDDAEFQKAVERRAREVTARYRGRIAEYDLNNEMLFYNYYKDRLGDQITADMARCAKQGDPNAVLYANQWGILTGNGTARYVKQIRGLLDRKIPIGGIGCQGHFDDKPMDIPKIRRNLDALAQFKLPIKITEFDINTSDEQLKARELEAFYRLCLSHPAVKGVYMWGFWEGRHWRSKAALWKKDWTPTPAAKVYRRLVYNEWWTRFEGKADASGRCELRGFYGTHLVESGGKQKRIEFKSQDQSATVDLNS